MPDDLSRYTNLIASLLEEWSRLEGLLGEIRQMDPQFPYPISLSNVYWAARASSVMVKMSFGKLGSCGVSWEVDDDDLAEWEEGRREVEVEGRWPARFLDETEEDRDEEEVVERECAGWILLLLLCWLLMAIKEEVRMISKGLKDRGCRWCSGMRRLKGTVLCLGVASYKLIDAVFI